MGKLLYYYATINLILYLAFYFQCINAGQCIRPLIYEKKSGKTDPTEYFASCDKNIQTLQECNAAMRVLWSWKQLSAVDQTDEENPKGCYWSYFDTDGSYRNLRMGVQLPCFQDVNVHIHQLDKNIL